MRKLIFLFIIHVIDFGLASLHYTSTMFYFYQHQNIDTRSVSRGRFFRLGLSLRLSKCRQKSGIIYVACVFPFSCYKSVMQVNLQHQKTNLFKHKCNYYFTITIITSQLISQSVVPLKAIPYICLDLL